MRGDNVGKMVVAACLSRAAVGRPRVRRGPRRDGLDRARAPAAARRARWAPAGDATMQHVTQTSALPADAPARHRPHRRLPLVRALRGDRPETLPVWFMRQAGRSLPEYRELRVGTKMLDACLDPELSSEITLQPVRRHGVDAGIFFSDIVVPIKLAGVGGRHRPRSRPGARDADPHRRPTSRLCARSIRRRWPRSPRASRSTVGRARRAPR